MAGSRTTYRSTFLPGVDQEVRRTAGVEGGLQDRDQAAVDPAQQGDGVARLGAEGGDRHIGRRWVPAVTVAVSVGTSTTRQRLLVHRSGAQAVDRRPLGRRGRQIATAPNASLVAVADRPPAAAARGPGARPPGRAAAHRRRLRTTPGSSPSHRGRSRGCRR